jgi:hypothetical protein
VTGPLLHALRYAAPAEESVVPQAISAIATPEPCQSVEMDLGAVGCDARRGREGKHSFGLKVASCDGCSPLRADGALGVREGQPAKAVKVAQAQATNMGPAPRGAVTLARAAAGRSSQ